MITPLLLSLTRPPSPLVPPLPPTPPPSEKVYFDCESLLADADVPALPPVPPPPPTLCAKIAGAKSPPVRIVPLLLTVTAPPLPALPPAPPKVKPSDRVPLATVVSPAPAAPPPPPML